MNVCMLNALLGQWTRFQNFRLSLLSKYYLPQARPNGQSLTPLDERSSVPTSKKKAKVDEEFTSCKLAKGTLTLLVDLPCRKPT